MGTTCGGLGLFSAAHFGAEVGKVAPEKWVEVHLAFWWHLRHQMTLEAPAIELPGEGLVLGSMEVLGKDVSGKGLGPNGNCEAIIRPEDGRTDRLVGQDLHKSPGEGGGTDGLRSGMGLLVRLHRVGDTGDEGCVNDRESG